MRIPGAWFDADMAFSDDEIGYIRSQPLVRVATAAPDGQPDVVPVAFEFDGFHFYIGGWNPTNTRRTKNVAAGNDKVALVIDDLATPDPWAPLHHRRWRFLRIYGTAELVDREAPNGPVKILKITPTISWSSNLSDNPSTEDAGNLQPRRTVH